MTSSKHDDSNYDQFAQNFCIAYKTIQRVSKFEVVWINKTELQAKEVEKLTFMLYGKNGLVGILLPINTAVAV